MAITHRAIFPTKEAYEAAGNNFNGSPKGNIFEVPVSKVDPLKSLINEPLVSMVERLEKECGYALVPKQYTSMGQETLVRLTGGRSCSPSYKTFYLNLGALGWGEPGEMQLCYVDVKGSGSASSLDEPKELELDMSSMSFLNRPLGSQNQDFAESSLEYSIKIAKGTSRIKVVPVFEVVSLPFHVVRNIRKSEYQQRVFDRQGNYFYPSKVNFKRVETWFAQEKRLMPSCIRANNLFSLGFPIKSAKVASFFKKKGDDIEDIIFRIFQDAKSWLENVPLTTRKESGRSNGRFNGTYIWQRVGNISHPGSYKTKKSLERSIDQTLFQDLVIAPSGIYFADIESLEDVETSAHDLHLFHRHYLRSVLCSFTKIISALRLGDYQDRFVRSRSIHWGILESLKRQTPKGVLQELGEQLEKSDLVSLEVKKECVDLTVNYPHIGRREQFRFSLDDYLPYSKRLLAKGLLPAGD